MRRKLAAGNWKMHGTSAEMAEVEALMAAHPAPTIDMLICPPATLLHRLSALAKNHPLELGGQDSHPAIQGAYTGEISAPMLKDAGATYVILGHSERRAAFHESSDDVRAKAKAAMDASLKTIICIGESLLEREAMNTLDILGGQLAGSIPDLATGENLVVAYEPIWAIGTGKVASLSQIGEVHDFIRNRLERRFGAGVGRSTRLLYGGSVKPENAAEIFATSNVDGALVGGASLKATDFSPIIEALSKA